MFSITQEWAKPAYFLAVLLNLVAFCLLPSKAGASGWVLTQRSKEMGDQYVYLSPNGLKCVNPRQGVGLVARAPSWNVFFYNEKTRLYYSLTFDSWRRKLEARRRAPRNIAWRKSQSGNVAGLKATKYVASNSTASSVGRGNAWSSADCWVADQIKVPQRLAEMLTTVYGLPTTQAVPLRVTYTDLNGREETILDTYQQQSTPVPDSYLTAPSGYKLAKSEVEVLMTAENRQLVDDIARDLGREPGSLSSNRPTSQSTSSSPTIPSNVNIPENGVTLPNGQNISKDQIGKFIDAYKQYKQSH